MSQISSKDFINKLQKESCHIVDVRNGDEFSIDFIPSSQNIPLDTIENGSHSNIPKDKPVFLVCRSGRRSLRAGKILQAQGYKNVISVDGGILECAKTPNIVTKKSKNISIMRQVQIVAGLLILFGIVCAHFIHPYFIFLSGFVGAGLLFAGVTGFCGMGILLEKMPWNKNIASCSLNQN